MKTGIGTTREVIASGLGQFSTMERVGAESDDENEKSESVVQSVSVFRLVFFAFVVMTPVIPTGMTVTYSSIALPQMNLSLDDASWFGSMTSITCPFGCLFIGLIIDKYGRRISLLSSLVPNIFGWLLLAERNASMTRLCLGRLLTGFSVGAASLPSIVYVAECITVNNLRLRSSIGTWSTFSMGIGSFLVYVSGAILPYNEVALVSATLSVLSLFLILIFVPESPAWLYRKGRVGDAEMAQQCLAIKQPILLQDRRMSSSAAVTLITANLEADECSWENLTRYLGKITRREVYRPLIVTITFLFFAQFSGLYCLVSYMVDVITVSPIQLSPYILSVVCGALQIVGCLLLTFVLPHTGVKRLSAVSFLGSSAGFVTLAFSILFENASTANLFNYLHVISIWVVMMFGSVGLMAIPYAILGEMFPMGAKGYASLSLFACSVFNFVVLKMFPYLFARYKNIVFFVFAGICAGGAAFVVNYLPETVGKTFEEIKKGFQRTNSNANARRV